MMMRAITVISVMIITIMILINLMIMIAVVLVVAVVVVMKKGKLTIFYTDILDFFFWLCGGSGAHIPAV